MVGGWWDGLLLCPREKVVVSSCSNNDNYEVADCDTVIKYLDTFLNPSLVLSYVPRTP